MIIDADTLRGMRAGTEFVSIRSLWKSEREGESSITTKAKDAAGESYATAVFPCEGFLEFGGSLLRTHAPVQGWAGVSSPRFHELWTTFLAIVRPGDDVRIVWSANGHANCHIHDANLNVDTCQLEIRRGEGRTAKRLRFHITETICPANTARMFTQGENGFGPIDGPAAHGEAHGHVKLTGSQVAAIRERALVVSVAQIAREYDTPYTTIYSIVGTHGKNRRYQEPTTKEDHHGRTDPG